MSSKQLKILMVLHIPWSRELGGARVQLELADEFEAEGHMVEKFDARDAFPTWTETRLGALFAPAFSKRAIQFLRSEAKRFDVIDAQQGNVPYAKSAYGFSGLMINRSVGLYSFYEKFALFAQSKWPSPRSWKTALAQPFRDRKARENRTAVEASFQFADLITVPNRDEADFLSRNPALSSKVRLAPFGLSASRHQAFGKGALEIERRRAGQRVVFVGWWHVRKGSRDWPAIYRAIKQAVPGVTFDFFGTSVSEDIVRRELGAAEDPGVTVVPEFTSSNLPKHLENATVGAFPSYIEGFGFSVLETLAAGAPTVAYDVPGPREMLRHTGNLTPTGDPASFAAKVIEILQADSDAYAGMAREARKISDGFLWKDIAALTLEHYRGGLAQLHRL